MSNALNITRMKPRARHILGRCALAAGLLAMAPLPIPSALAGEMTRLRVSASSLGSTQHIAVGLNKSVLIDFPVDVHEVIVSQPAVAGNIMRSKRRAIIQGMAPGETNIFFLDARGDAISVIEISVTNDASTLRSTLARVIPGSRIDVQSFGERVILSGTAQSADDVQKALSIAAQFVGGVDNVASVIKVGGGQQVMLKVTVAEVSRETVKQLGINLSASFSSGGLSTGLISNQPVGGASNVIAPSTVTAGVDIGNFSLDATLRALERRGAVRTLAEPTLTAMSGQEAEFLAGGSFPVPVGIDQAGMVTFEFKEFGVKLKFTPTVRSDGIIALAVDTSVSEPTTEGGFTTGNLTIPATKNRQAKTSVEMSSGMTLAIAGLIEDKLRQQFNSLPGVGNIPIIGALFRSRDFIHSQTELVILVTPYLAEPGGPVALPTDSFHAAGDAEAIFLGHMEKLYGVGETGEFRGGYDGAVGFVLD